MNVQRCLEILREVKDVAFATVDERDFLKFVLLM